MANPAQVREFFPAAREALGDDVELTAHFHNTRGQGLANVLAALDAGVTRFESSFGELGGCPVPRGRDRQHRHRGPGLDAARDGHRDRRLARAAARGRARPRRRCSGARSARTCSPPGRWCGTSPQLTDAAARRAGGARSSRRAARPSWSRPCAARRAAARAGRRLERRDRRRGRRRHRRARAHARRRARRRAADGRRRASRGTRSSRAASAEGLQGFECLSGHPRLDRRDADPERRRLRAGGRRDRRVGAGATTARPARSTR